MKAQQKMQAGTLFDNISFPGEGALFQGMNEQIPLFPVIRPHAVQMFFKITIIDEPG